MAAQLGTLSRWAGLGQETHARLDKVFETLTAEALDQPVGGAYPGLSRINANGLPFQWCLTLGGRRAVRFLCESGAPGDNPRNRLAHSLDRLAGAAAIAGSARLPAWFTDAVLPHVLPTDAAWPAHWRSALWTGVGAADGDIVLKPYLNLNRDRPIDRWRRVGHVLASLERQRALETLCAVSGLVSEESWPVGLAIDILPGGQPGRVKIYFRSGAVGPSWLAHWYRSLGGSEHEPAVRLLLDAFPKTGRGPYPERSFITTLEFHSSGEATLKTDLAITRWPTNNPLAQTRQLLTRLGSDADGLSQALSALSASQVPVGDGEQLRFVGLGYEPDGSRHVNVYVEPPSTARATATAVPHWDISTAVTGGVRFLQAAQHTDHWRDFQLPVGESDQWVTAYVLAQLGRLVGVLDLEGLTPRVERALDWLGAVRSGNGGWGYNATTGDDADSTAWAGQALRIHGRSLPAEVRQMLLGCLSPSGGVVTYPTGAASGPAWSTPTAEVTAPALRALDGTISAKQFGAGRHFVHSQGRSDGLWSSYWWLSPLYATREALSLSLSMPHAGPSDATVNALRKYVPCGPYESALLLQCRLFAGLQSLALELVRPLLRLQWSDGSWDGTAYLRLTHPDVYEPWATIDAGPVFQDVNRVFTTATVLSALADAFTAEGRGATER